MAAVLYGGCLRRYVETQNDVSCFRHRILKFNVRKSLLVKYYYYGSVMFIGLLTS